MAKKTARGVIPTEASSEISVIAEGLDEAKRRYFLLGVEGKPDPKLPPMLASRFSDDQTRVSSALTNAGFNLISSTAKTAFFKSVQEWSKKDPSFKVATRIGWHGEKNYVLPGKIFGPSKNLYDSLAELDSDVLAKYRVRNSLSDWQKQIGNLCVNNSRLMFAVSFAFTGPILRFVQGDRSVGFQIYGEGEKGKSTAAMVAGSVWGCHLRPDKGFMESWNTTANKVELTAFAHNDGLLILDETENAGDTDPQRIAIIKTVIFRLAEQIEKNRLTNAERVGRGVAIF